jgi:hypothetical protein
MHILNMKQMSGFGIAAPKIRPTKCPLMRTLYPDPVVYGLKTCVTGDFHSVKFELQFFVKIDSQGILFAFTHRVLQIRTVKMA